MGEAADFCWVGADGALHSGSADELMRAYVAGLLPLRHPVWRQGWTEWLELADVLAERRLEAPDTEREPEPLTEPVLTLVRPLLDPDATAEELTQPLRPVFAFKPPCASLPAGGVARTLPPPVQRPRKRRSLALLGVALALTGAATALAIVLWATDRAAVATLGRARVALPSPAAFAPAEAGGCVVEGAPELLSERVAPGASLHLAGVNGGRVALGVTSTPKSGFGYVVALAPLAVVERQLFSDPVHLAGVVPGPGGFGLDRFTRRVNGERSFALGMTPAGFSRIDEDGTQTTLWSGESREVISRPVLARSGDRWAVAFRRGDDSRAAVRLGFLDARGERLSELGTLTVASGSLEGPTLAANARRFVVAHSVRQPLESPWAIEVGTAKAGELPATTLRFSGGDSTRDQRRPALAPLPNGRWLLVWAEGDRQSGRRLRAHVLDEALALEGKAIELAAVSDWVGSVAAEIQGDRVLVAFTERARPESETLRAVVMKCR